MTPKAAPTHFSPVLFSFLGDLEKNNDRAWFQANKRRYEEDVQHPALQFISDFGPRLAKISPHFQAIPKAVGGSMFRIYRDTRFSKDKSPYKTYVGLRFLHREAKDVHAPVFYLHLQRGQVFVGVGIWHPDGGSLKKIRDAIVADPAAWKRARDAKGFRDAFELAGDKLKRPPRGYDPEHPLIDDIKRKDFIGSTRLTQKEVTAPGFIDRFTGYCKAGTPLVRYLCGAVGVPF